MQEVEFKIVELRPSDRLDGKFNLVVKMVSLYENGKFVKHLPLTPDLAELIKNQRIKLAE